MNAPMSALSLSPAEATASFLRLASIEITPKQIEKLSVLKAKLEPGTRVFVALIDAGDLSAQIEAVRQLKAEGFQPVPHVPARFVKDEADLHHRIKALAEAGSDSMLVLGGGVPQRQRATGPAACRRRAGRSRHRGACRSHGNLCGKGHRA